VEAEGAKDALAEAVPPLQLVVIAERRAAVEEAEQVGAAAPGRGEAHAPGELIAEAQRLRDPRLHPVLMLERVERGLVVVLRATDVGLGIERQQRRRLRADRSRAEDGAAEGGEVARALGERRHERRGGDRIQAGGLLVTDEKD